MNATLFLGLAVSLSAPTIKDSPKPAPAIVGEWVPDSLTMGGVTTTAPEGRSYEFTAHGLWITRRDGVAVKSYPDVYELDSKADPPSIDKSPLVRLDDNRAPSPMLGIYQLEGDTLTICLGGEVRPKTFESPDGSRNLLLVLKRVKKKD
jgi:uncharacterized protein (TIGR03067 family)